MEFIREQGKIWNPFQLIDEDNFNYCKSFFSDNYSTKSDENIKKKGKGCAMFALPIAGCFPVVPHRCC